MDENGFWAIIDKAHKKAGDDNDMLLELLGDSLLMLPPAEILDFARMMRKFHDQSYRADLWGAAYIIQDGSSEDDFDGFRAWLIAQGREIFEAALKHPDSLVAVASCDNNELEEIMELPEEIYSEKTGKKDFHKQLGKSPRPKLAGDRHSWASSDGDMDEDKVRELYPKLCERFLG